MIRLPIAALCAASLVAQSPSLESLDRRIAATRQGQILVLGPAEYQKAFQGVAQQEPLLEHQLPILALNPTESPTAALAARQGWSSEPRWAWLDRQRKVRLQGTTLPRPAELKEQLHMAGWKDEEAALLAYLRAQPDSIEAWHQLWMRRLNVASIRMAPYLGRAKPGDFGETLVKPLSDEEDARIWGPTGEALEQLFRREGWAVFGSGQYLPTSLPLLPDHARHSALMRRICELHLPKVEAALLAAPSNRTASAYVACARVAGSTQIRKILPKIIIAPGSETTMASYFNAYSAWRIQWECRQQEDWPTLAALLAETFENERNTLLTPEDRKRLWGQGAKQLFPELVEVLLRAGQSREADTIVKEFCSLGYAGTPELASAGATAASLPEFAKVWKDLPVAATFPPTSPLKEILGRHRVMLLVLAPGAGPWTARLTQHLESEPWKEMELPHKVLLGEAAERIVGALGRTLKQGWLVLNARATVLAEGTEPPEAGELSQILEHANALPSLKALEAFCQAHPEHLGAQWALLRLELARAAQRTQGMATPSQPRTGTGPGADPAAPLPALSEDQDQKIWGRPAKRIARLFQDTDWLWDEFLAKIPKEAARSPLMLRAAKQILPHVQAMLARFPGQGGLWGIWGNLSALVAHQGALPFLASLRPLPFQAAVPPDYLLEPVVRALGARQAWGELRDLLEVDRMRSWDSDEAGPTPDSFKGVWSARVAPLLEAYLRLGDIEKAHGVLQSAMARLQAPELPQLASQLARVCGNSTLATRWGNLHSR